MDQSQNKGKLRSVVVVNYLCLVIMNLCFFYVTAYEVMTHMAAMLGILVFILVVFTSVRVHMNSGLWKLTHAQAEMLDERELQVTHRAIHHAYGWFSIICLAIMLVHAFLVQMGSNMEALNTIPLVTSLIYFAHTLPGSILAWTERDVPGDAE